MTRWKYDRVSKIAKRDLAASCIPARLFVRPHGMTCLPVDGFS